LRYYTTMKKHIAVLPGDGVGPEIVKEAQKVLNAIAKKYDHEFSYEEGLIGAAAIDAVNDPYPAETHALCEKSDAVLFGAIGDPRFDNDPMAKVRLLFYSVAVGGTFVVIVSEVIFAFAADGVGVVSPSPVGRIKSIVFQYIDTLTNTGEFGIVAVVLMMITVYLVTVLVYEKKWRLLWCGLPIMLLWIVYTLVYFFTPLPLGVHLSSSFPRLFLHLLPMVWVWCVYLQKNSSKKNTS